METPENVKITPVVGEMVQVTVMSKDELGYIVNIHGHNKEGFILLSGGVRNKKYNVGEIYTAKIIRMGDAKGSSWGGDRVFFIDLEFEKPSSLIADRRVELIISRILEKK